MALYQSILSYDGTEFHGFQRQAQGIRTVQGTVEEALRTLGWSDASLLAAGRTDAGVHARGQVISFELEWSHDSRALTRALNDRLPSDAAVISSVPAESGFHPRFSALWRRYRYRVYQSPVRDPLRERYALRVWPGVDFEVLRVQSTHFLGRQDFRAFGAAPIEGGHTVRTIHAMDWTVRDDELVLDIVADAFLQHMVRRIVGACLDVASGGAREAELAELIGEADDRWEGTLAKPGGLVLMEVGYRVWDGAGSIEIK